MRSRQTKNNKPAAKKESLNQKLTKPIKKRPPHKSEESVKKDVTDKKAHTDEHLRMRANRPRKLQINELGKINFLHTFLEF